MEILGGLLGFIMESANDAKEKQKRQKQLEENDRLLDVFESECIVEAKNSILLAKQRLFREGMEETIEYVVKGTSSFYNFIPVYLKALKEESGIEDVYAYIRKIWDKLFVGNENIISDEVMKDDYIKSKDKLIKILNDKILEYIRSEVGVVESYNRYFNFEMIVGMLCLLEIITDDHGYRATVEALYQYHQVNRCLFTFLHQEEHGVFQLPNLDKYDIEKVEKEIAYAETHMVDNTTGYFEGLRENLTSGFLHLQGVRMWYYANQPLVNQAAFSKAEESMNQYRSAEGTYLECVLAEAYVKNKLGGETLVMQNINEIMEKAAVNNPIFAQTLCSFLAWIECYNVELDVLKKAVQEKIQLSPEMLERLEFLAKGGASNKFKIYEPDTDSDDFLFDSSTENIDTEGLDVIFNMLKKKKQPLAYALALKRWNKTLPLSKGRTFSIEALDNAFCNLVDDFDGEVKLHRTNATAVNLNNMKYLDCSLFEFTSERNRGLALIFQCEKFGRNLNLSFLTLFLPDKQMGETAVDYAKAILSNQYIESFQESILQALDESLVENHEIYDTQPLTTTNSTFFE